MQKVKWLSEEALQIAEKRSERQRRKGKIYPREQQGEIRWPSKMNNAKKQRETIAWERLDMHTKKKNESKHNN